MLRVLAACCQQKHNNCVICADERRWRNVGKELFRCRQSPRTSFPVEITDNAIPPSARLAGRSSRTAKGCPMHRADPLIGSVASQQNPTTDIAVDSVLHRFDGTTTSVAEPLEPMIGTAGERRPASPVRLTLASRLGNEIDGAWWPRTGLISRELAELVSVLDVRLGGVVDINVNWSSLQRQPDLNWAWWQGIHPHVMTVAGHDDRSRPEQRLDGRRPPGYQRGRTGTRRIGH